MAETGAICTEIKSSVSSVNVQLERSNPLPRDSERWQTLVEAIGNFIASDMQPLSVVENSGFRQMMHIAEPCFKVPS